MEAQLTPSRRRRLTALALSCFALLYAFPYQSNLNNPNENVRLYMTAAIVEEGVYEIDSLRDRWGWVNDAATHDGHVYSVKAPGTSLLGVPAYALYLHGSQWVGRAFDRTEALWLCRVTASILPTLWFLWVFHGWLGRQARHPALRDAVFLSVAFGSLLYGYAMLFVSHTLSAAVAFGAFMLLYDMRFDERKRTPARAWAAGLLAAAATLFEYPGLVASMVLAVYGLIVLRTPRNIVGFAAGGLLPTLTMMHFQWKAFGSPFTPGHLMVETEALREAHHEGLYGAVGPTAASLHGLLTDLGAGLFPMTPLLLFAPLGFWVLLRDRSTRDDAICALLVVVLTVLAISSMNNWRGGWTIGPRYLALTVPFVGWVAMEGLAVVAEKIPLQTIALAVGCTAVGMLASGIPSVYYPHLPPEFTRPLPQLFNVLIDHDYAPPNFGNLLGLYGTTSMLPLLAAALFALGWCVQSIDGLRRRAQALGGALLIALSLSVPVLMRPAAEPGVAGAVAFVTSRWSPAGHDVIARSVARLKGQDRVSDRDLQALSKRYEREGRLREARRAAKGRLP